MNAWQVLQLFSLLVYVSLIVLILVKNPKSSLSRSGVILLFCFVVWSFGNLFLHNPQTSRETARLFENINSFGWASFAGFYLWFALIFTQGEKVPRRTAFYLLLFAGPAFFIYKQWTNSLISDVAGAPFGWTNVWSNSIWTFLFFAFYLSTLGFALYLLYCFWKKSGDPLQKKQSRIIFWTTLVALIVGTLTDVVFPEMKILVVPPLGSSMALIWSWGILYAIARFKFLIITPAQAADQILSTMMDALFLLDPRGFIVGANRPAADLLGYPLEELKGREFDALITNMDLKREFRESIGKVEDINNRDFSLLDNHGKAIPVLLSSSLLKAKEGDLSGIICIARDVSGKIELERKLERSQESLERLTAAVEQSTEGIAIADPEGKLFYANLAFARLHGLGLAECIGKNQASFRSPDLPPSSASVQSRLEETGEYSGEIWHVRRDRTRFPCLVHNSLLLDENGNRIGVIALVRDITEKKQAEKALLESEEKYRLLVEHSLHGFVILQDFPPRLVYVNQIFADQAGRSAEDLISAPPGTIFELIHPQDRERVSSNYKLHLEGKMEPLRYEFRMVDKSGSLRWLEIFPSRVVFDGKPSIQASFVDIGKAKKAQEELVDSEERFKKLFEAAPDGYYLSDLKGYFLDGNKAAEEIVGYSRKELIGKSFLKLRLLQKGQLPKAAKLLAKNMLGLPTGPDEFLLNRPDNKRIPVEIRTFPIKIKGKTVVLGIARDITKRKQYENELYRAKERAEAANRAKSDFLAGMSHELRTPLNAILGFSEVLEEQYYGRLNEKQAEFVRDIMESGRHLLDMINDILDLSKIEVGKMKLKSLPIQIGEFLEHSLIMIKQQCLEHGVRLSLEVEGSVWRKQVVMDERRMKQVMFNLLSNAVKFTPDGGAITVRAEENGRGLVVSVEDSGIGVAKEYQDKIFDKFFQLRSGIENKTPGAGLGLNLSKRIVEMHGGRIWVESEGEGKGSRFSFMLPTEREEQKRDGAQ